jgi:tRNA(Arg) A34 adenosine deaminase TadA
MNDEKKFLSEAIKLAVENVKNGNGGPFGAVVVKDGVIIGRGANSVTTANDPTAHAEVVAIRDACKNLGSFQLDGCVVYSSCEPCPMCLGAIYWARPEKLIFAATKEDASNVGFDDSFIYEEIAVPIGQRKICTEHLQHEDTLNPFTEWTVSQNKIEY